MRKKRQGSEGEWQRVFSGKLALPEKCRAFTLVELLVAVAVLTMLLVLLLQISGSTLQATRRSNQQMNAVQASRMALDALGMDLANVIIQNGFTLFVKQDAVANNTQLAFLSQCRGPANVNSADYRCMAVAYQLENNRLTRRAVPVLWSDKDFTSIIAGAASSTTVSVLAANVLRFEAVAVLDDGTTVPLSKVSTSTTLSGQSVPNSFSALTLANPLEKSSQARVRSIIVAIATLDGQTFRLNGAAEMAGSLPSPNIGQTPLDAWNATISSGSLDTFPRPAVADLQMDQRTFPLK